MHKAQESVYLKIHAVLCGFVPFAFARFACDIPLRYAGVSFVQRR